MLADTFGFVSSFRAQGIRTSYVKPVQTGSASDAGFVSRHAPTCRSRTIFSYTDPVSPHLAAARDGVATADAKILDAVVEEIKAALAKRDAPAKNAGGRGASEANDMESYSLVLVETAGGVLSPAPSGALQADAFRPLRLPVLLVGDGRLGGIGSTLSALESLKMRGYTVHGVALIAQGEVPRKESLVDVLGLARRWAVLALVIIPEVRPCGTAIDAVVEARGHIVLEASSAVSGRDHDGRALSFGVPRYRQHFPTDELTWTTCTRRSRVPPVWPRVSPLAATSTIRRGPGQRRSDRSSHTLDPGF